MLRGKTVYPLLLIYTIVVGLLLSCDNTDNRIISISCWGDSKTEGDSQNLSYATFLGRMLGEGYAVYNFGANGETSQEILMRQGAYPLICKSFKIPANNTDSARIIINSRMRVPKAGCNPCIINEIEGEIIRKNDSVFFSEIRGWISCRGYE